MIYTLTLNPAIDINQHTTVLNKNHVTRTYDAVYGANGKGINVSVTLDNFGVKSKILGFFGGFSGKYIMEECKRKGMEIVGIDIQGTTRINIILNTNDAEYNLVNEGPTITSDEMVALLQKINLLNDADIIVISGSMAKGMPDSFYDDIFKILCKKGVRVILDISSKKLKDLLKYNPCLIKPNNEEIEDIFGIRITNEDDAINALKNLHELGAENILLTMGSKGSYFYDGRDIYYVQPFPINVKSTVCCGDAYLGAFLSIWLKDKDNVVDALKLAGATGANVAECDGLGDFKKVFSYKEQILVKEIKIC